jgi:hypothetical protein
VGIAHVRVAIVADARTAVRTGLPRRLDGASAFGAGRHSRGCLDRGRSGELDHVHIVGGHASLHAPRVRLTAPRKAVQKSNCAAVAANRRGPRHRCQGVARARIDWGDIWVRSLPITEEISGRSADISRQVPVELGMAPGLQEGKHN